ncbi:hypothetical protein J5N97_010349 [Dioscorea zingiberensis]|uniref:C2H2-type domain-containing protein n=1 Tax=Dioscorea zingiberensis TaxID=325984 RepID=A0A9D5CZX3_9LILI|nr:hypothetical protein J5N97_010349 [Dioscorea zingiberensis]
MDIHETRVSDNTTSTSTSTSLHVKCKSSYFATQEEYLAFCLVMLAKGDEARLRVPPPPLKLAYKCSVCSKEFSSYQALGGHKSSHRGLMNGTESRSVSSFSGSMSLSTGSGASGSGKAHQCTICHRNFASGQALGGHKRCHYWEGSSSSSSGVRGFDLNLPPLPEFGAVSWTMGEEEEVQSPSPFKKPRLVVS